MLWAALALAAGISTGVHAWRPPLWWLVAWIVFAASGVYLLRRRGRFAFILGLGSLFILGAFMVQVRGPASPSDSSVLQFADGTEVIVTAHVTKEGTLQENGQRDVRQRLDVETEQIARGNEKLGVRSGVRISIYDARPNTAGQDSGVASARLFRYGERLRFPAKIYPPRNFRNPGAFDYQGYLTENGIVALASTKAASVEVLPGFAGSGLNSGAHEFIAASLEESMPCGRRAKLR